MRETPNNRETETSKTLKQEIETLFQLVEKEIIVTHDPNDPRIKQYPLALQRYKEYLKKQQVYEEYRAFLKAKEKAEEVERAAKKYFEELLAMDFSYKIYKGNFGGVLKYEKEQQHMAGEKKLKIRDNPPYLTNENIVIDGQKLNIIGEKELQIAQVIKTRDCVIVIEKKKLPLSVPEQCEQHFDVNRRDSEAFQLFFSLQVFETRPVVKRPDPVEKPIPVIYKPDPKFKTVDIRVEGLWASKMLKGTVGGKPVPTTTVIGTIHLKVGELRKPLTIADVEALPLFVREKFPYFRNWDKIYQQYLKRFED